MRCSQLLTFSDWRIAQERVLSLLKDPLKFRHDRVESRTILNSDLNSINNPVPYVVFTTWYLGISFSRNQRNQESKSSRIPRPHTGRSRMMTNNIDTTQDSITQRSALPQYDGYNFATALPSTVPLHTVLYSAQYK